MGITRCSYLHLRTMNFIIPDGDRTDSSSESLSTTYYTLPKLQHDKNGEIVNKLQLINDYIKHLEDRGKHKETDQQSNGSGRNWNSFLADSKELHTKLSAASTQCCTLQKNFQCAKTLLKEEEKIKDKRKTVTSPKKKVRQESFQTAVLLQPPSHLPTKVEYTINENQQRMRDTRNTNQVPSSSAFSIKTLGHYSHMFLDSTSKKKNTNLEEIYRNLETSMSETIRKISGLNHRLNCCKDDKKKHQLQFQLTHLANEIELKKAQLAKLEQFVIQDREETKNCNGFDDTIMTNLRHGDEVQIVTTVKSSRDNLKPLSVSHVTRRNRDSPTLIHSCPQRTSAHQLKPSDLSWQ